jgi:hypothetical protein
MSERSSISLEEVLGDNYYIDKLTSSEYSPAVGDTVTITLLVKDVFGDPASGQTRTVTCTGGQFVSMNGTSITASSSVDVTTSSSGTVTLGLSVSVADTITVSDGMADCVVCSLSTSIANLVQVQEVAVNMGTISSGGNSTKTATVSACPTGYSSFIAVKTTSWCICSASSLTGTTLSFTGMNLHSRSHTCWITVYVVYYPSSWKI